MLDDPRDCKFALSSLRRQLERAEGLGLECKVGWFERPERMVLLIVAGLFGLGPAIPAALLLSGESRD